MNYFKSFIKGFQLNYADKQMEKEYITIEHQNNIDNTQFSLYFIVFLLLFPGVPALIDQAYWDFGVVLLTVVVIFIISCCKVIPRQYVQFLIAIVICSFNYCLFLLSSSSFDSSSKGTIFYRGYSSSSINVTLLARFTTLRQKILFLIYAFVFRFTLISLLDPNSVQTITIIRHIYVDTFVACASFLDDKKRRVIFKKFYEFREELTKFKELLANYLPQSITIFGGRLQKPLFSNKSFSETFDDTDYGNEAKANSNLLTSFGKPQLKTLEIDPRTVREVGEKSFHLNLQNKVECFEDVFEELNRQNALDNRTISLSASYSSQEEYKSFEVILTKIKWDTEDAVAVILNDITYQENIIRLRISDANKDRIIATVSHELRTPLNGILGILEIAGKRIDDEKTLEYLELCKDNAHLLLNLVNSLLDLHQVRHGKLRTNSTILEVRKVLEGVTKLFVFQCNQKGITLKFHIADSAPKHIYTDENRLKQILINLIGNSLKFTSKGEITVEVEQDSDNEEYLQISVSDTGIGIKEEDKDKLFQMYEKIEHGRSVNKNGVGLGLTISNTLAGILNGKKDERVIEVISQVNKGSKFSFKILKNLEASNERDSKCLSNLFNNPENESQSLEEMNSQEELEVPIGVENGELTARNIPKQMESYAFIFQPPSAIFLDMKKATTRSKYSPASHLDDPLTNQKSQLIRRNSGLVTPKGDKGYLLAVDDNPFNLLVAQNLAQDIGYTLTMAQSGQEAIEVMRCRSKDNPPFKAILMDCQMPIMDGFEVTKTLRKMMEKGEVQNVPIIALTANNAEEDIKRCYEVGMVDHLSKPLFVHELEKALNGLEK